MMESPYLTKEIIWWFSRQHNEFKKIQVASLFLKHFPEDEAFLRMVFKEMFGPWKSVHQKRNILRECMHNGLKDLFIYFKNLMGYTPKSMWSFFKIAMDNRAWDIAKHIHVQYPSYGEKYMTDTLRKNPCCPTKGLIRFCIENGIKVSKFDSNLTFYGNRYSSDVYCAVVKDAVIDDHIPYLISFSFFHTSFDILKMYPEVDLGVISKLILLGNSHYTTHEDFVSLYPQYALNSTSIINLVELILSANPTGYHPFFLKLTTLLRKTQMSSIDCLTILENAMDSVLPRNRFHLAVLNAIPWILKSLHGDVDTIEYLFDYSIARRSWVFTWFLAVELFTIYDIGDKIQVFKYHMQRLYHQEEYRKIEVSIRDIIENIHMYCVHSYNNTTTYMDWCRLNRNLFTTIELMRKVKASRT